MFTKTGEVSSVEKIPDDDGYFTLEVGDYTVTVLAYIGETEPYTLAAVGVSEEFSVGSGDNDPVEVILSEVDTGEQGKFSYAQVHSNTGGNGGGVYLVGGSASIRANFTMEDNASVSNNTATPPPLLVALAALLSANT